jgi:hypothetical protein
MRNSEQVTLQQLSARLDAEEQGDTSVERRGKVVELTLDAAQKQHEAEITERWMRSLGADD